MNQVFGDEHTSNPPILSQVLSSQTFTFPETENADESTRLTPQSELMPTPSVSPNNGDERSEVGSNFNSGRKNKRKGTANPKSEALIDLMLKKLELEEEQCKKKEIKEAEHVERQEIRADKLINIMETLVNRLG